MLKWIIFFNLIILVSTFFLIKLLSIPDHELDLTSKIRFFCLLAVNFVASLSSIISIKLEGTYRCVLLIFMACFSCVVGMTCCEVAVRDVEGDSYYNYMKSNHHQNLELTFLTFYFAVYIVVIFVLIISGAYLIATEYLIK